MDSSHTLTDLEAERLRAFIDTPCLYTSELPDGTPIFHTSATEGIAPEYCPVEYRGLRFGHIAEAWFSAWLSCQNRYRAVVENLQVIVDGKTLGELDYLLQDSSSGEIWHVELAYKIYLLRPDREGQWQGPNERDSLQRKLKKLREKQLPLLHQEACRKMLMQIGLDVQDIRQAVCLKGQLFVPQAYEGALSDGVNHEAVVGSWMGAEQAVQGLRPGETYAFPDKRDWVMPPRMDYHWVDKARAERFLRKQSEQGIACLCWVKDGEGNLRRFIALP